MDDITKLISQESLSLLFTQSPIALGLIMGEDMIIKAANKEMLEILGKDKSMINKTLLLALPEFENQPVHDFTKIVKYVYTTGQAFRGYKEKVLLKRNNVDYIGYYDFIFSPVHNKNNNIIGTSVICTEVTDQVMALLELEESKKKFENLINVADIPIALYKGEDHIIDIANDKMLQSWGKPENVVGKKLEDIVPELKEQKYIDILDKVYRTGETYYSKEDKISITIDGKLEEKYYNFSYQPLFDQNGKVYAILNFSTDVTDLTNAKKSILENKEKYKNLADSIPIIIWTTDENGDANYYNKQWYEYTGIEGTPSREDAIKQIIHPDDIDDAIKLWNNCKKSSTPYEIEYKFKDPTKEDSYRWFLGRSTPIKDENGKIQQWIGTCTDITEYKSLQQQKESFLGIASHELKTPLTSLKLYSQFLERNLIKINDIKNAAVASKMDKQIDKINSLINDLLDVTKIQNGKITLNKHDFDFDELILEIAQEQQMNTNHKIKLKLSKVGVIHGDRHRISQVMSNLISNAIKYSPDAEEILICSEDLGDRVHFCVKDYGIGISENKKEKVFQQYYRVSGDKEHTFPGLGLGLYISNEIIKRSGGQIIVNSVEGKGSNFCFEIPKTVNYIL